MKVKRTVRIVIVIILIALIGISGIELWGISAIYIKEAQTKDKLSAYRPVDPQNRANETESSTQSAAPDATADNTDAEDDTGDTLSNEKERPVRKTINQNIADLRNEINKAAVGWITIPDTHIDYPFVYCFDNDFYIRRDIYGASSQAGTLFMDQDCAVNLSDFNTIIYGHNMRNNTMFGDLPQFADDWFFNNNQYGTLLTQYDTYTLDIFAFMVVRSDDDIIYSPNGDRETFFDYVKENARNYREPDRSANVVSLSACGYEFTDARLVVLATLNTINN